MFNCPLVGTVFHRCLWWPLGSHRKNMPVWHHCGVTPCGTHASRHRLAGALLSLGRCQVGEASLSPPPQMFSAWFIWRQGCIHSVL